MANGASGVPQDAISSLQKALANGFDDYDYIKQDPNLSNLKDNREFQKLMEKY